MECMGAKALKSSLHRETATISTQQISFDDFWCGAGVTGVSGEDFSVDDLLDFSNGEFEDGYVEQEEEEKDTFSVSSQDQADDDNSSNTSSFSGSGDSEPEPLASVLAVPDDDLADLEWVSHFVDDSLSESLLYPGYNEKTENHAKNRFETGRALTKPLCFPSPVPARARTKRARTTGRAWSLGSLPTDSSSSSSSSSGFSSTPCLIFTNTVQTMELLHSFSEPPVKKPKKKPAVPAGGSDGSGGTQFQRRCNHCQVQRTPQWRTGPLGAKTLCNACGVRYKSGRLFPEYRPACSPTFSGDIHSNSHRKVLEMRRKKDVAGPESGLAQMVPSF